VADVVTKQLAKCEVAAMDLTKKINEAGNLLMLGPPEYAGAQAGQIMLLKAEQLLRSIVISSDINDALRLLAQEKLAAAGR